MKKLLVIGSAFGVPLGGAHEAKSPGMSSLLITYPVPSLSKLPIHRSASLPRITAVPCCEKSNPIFLLFRDKTSREGSQSVRHSSSVEEVEVELCHHLQQTHV